MSAVEELEEKIRSLRSDVVDLTSRLALRRGPSIPNSARPTLSPLLESAPNLNVLWAAALIEELRRGGLGHVVMCPGSRSAPLAIALAASRLPHTIAIDERGAAFTALGYARATGRCAAVVVSSGTAVANLHPVARPRAPTRHRAMFHTASPRPRALSHAAITPHTPHPAPPSQAVVEAMHDCVPLILLSADRPPELRDTGANQCIDQVHLLGRSLRWFKDMPTPEPSAPLEPLLSDAAYALARACGPPCAEIAPRSRRDRGEIALR